MFPNLLPIAFVLLGLMASLETRAEGVTFSFEPTMKATAPSTERLSAGTIIELRSTNLRANETLLLARCGEPCNTAKTVKRWDMKDFSASAKQTVRLSEDGEYYLWIRRKTENDEYGPVFGDHEKMESNINTLIFSSGTIVEISLISDGGPG